MASTYKARLLSSTVVPMLVGVALVGASISGPEANPMAQPRSGATQLAQACGACNPCDPCAAANPCNPCAAGAGAAYVMACAVPRLMAAAVNPCNPCAVAALANPCNPCAAANPCNPCAAANPCAVAALANPCDPCAAANPCNPCAAANPCNPCGAANPCAAAGAVKLTNAEAGAVWDCMLPNLQAAYSKSGHPSAMAFADWSVFGTVAYASVTHGNRYVQNMANGIAKVAYGKYEDVGKAPAGSQIAKPSIVVTGNGEVGVGPLFLMEKMHENFNDPSGDWRYTMIMPDGTIFGETLGQGTANVQFCADCHGAVAESQDNLFFLPKDFRVMAN